MRSDVLCLIGSNLLNQLLKGGMWLRTHQEIAFLKNESRHACNPCGVCLLSALNHVCTEAPRLDCLGNRCWVKADPNRNLSLVQPTPAA